MQNRAHLIAKAEPGAIAYASQVMVTMEEKEKSGQ